ncbi:EAL domain-containing protein [Microbacterium sp. NEAU-LLC]|uniref:EAL domain-containing protein n=1 Tax=Microbacterium helvum TaxID=2773713 RepID=A0ABR8NJ02_9MICO|nr:EAL domain-containing protein [Microbacterium helvum]MBD3940668.1 EAL domain-containing protein [Microbacterium helvum]
MLSSAQLTRDLRGALAAGDLSIAFQGQYDLPPDVRDVPTAGGPVVLEALCRWEHSTLGPIAPDVFIPLAERGEFLDQVDAHVFSRAAESIAQWRQAGFDVGLAVNASPAHFSTGYADIVMARLEELDLDPRVVTVEITEAPSPQLRPPMLSAIESLRAIGVTISVDDFAAGDTTVEMLELLPIDEVKLDRSLTQRTDAAADDAIAAVVETSEGHGWRVVAEGIETIADLARAVSRRCRRGQGYLWGAPLAVSDMGELLRRRR